VGIMKPANTGFITDPQKRNMLILPNPGYFDKRLPSATPQFFSHSFPSSAPTQVAADRYSPGYRPRVLKSSTLGDKQDFKGQ